jgi:ABC-type nickel/cobalt efflux system permease component RcnA
MPATASAHPLGDFTVNTSTAIVVRPGEVVLDLVVDMAEVPAYRERAAIDADGDGEVSDAEAAGYRDATCEALAGRLRLTVDGAAVRPATRRTTLSFPPGRAGLRTLRLRCVSAVPVEAGSHLVTYRDGTFPGRLGWREVLALGDGATILASDVPGRSPSDRLSSYPSGVVPLHVTTARLTFRPGGAARAGAALAPVSRAPGAGLLGAAVSRTDLGVGLAALLVLAAFGVGAVHALAPGHGKTLIGASMVASGGARQALAIAGAVAAMHTGSVLALGLLVTVAERGLAPERLYPWLGAIAGLTALGLGTRLFVVRLRELRGGGEHRHDHDGHAHAHGQAHGHARPTLSRSGLAAIALAGGILPSPSALLVLLGSVALGRATFGLLLVAAFSAGLAAALAAVGIVAARLGRTAEQRFPERLVRAVPVLAAACITVVGAVLTGSALAGA